MPLSSLTPFGSTSATAMGIFPRRAFCPRTRPAEYVRLNVPRPGSVERGVEAVEKTAAVAPQQAHGRQRQTGPWRRRPQGS